MTGPVVGCINTILSEIAGYEAGTGPTVLDPNRIHNLMQGLHLPSEWQMLQMSPLMPGTATALARATHLLQQGRSAVYLLTQQHGKDPHAVSDLLARLAEVFKASNGQFERARADLEKFFEMVEGPELQVGPTEG